MTHIPPVPTGNQSPYPIAEPPHSEQREEARRTDDRPPAKVDRTLAVGLAAGGVAALGAVGFAAYLFFGRSARTGNTPQPLTQPARRAGNQASKKPSKKPSGAKPKARPAAIKPASATRGKKAATSIKAATARTSSASARPSRPRKSGDDTSIRGPRDAARIAMGEEYEVAYWTDKFGIDRNGLRAAVNAVGNGSKAVADHLGKA